MRTLSGKKLILWALSLILCMTACAPAFASTGDRVLFHSSNQDGDRDDIQGLFPFRDGFILAIRTNEKINLLQYSDADAQPDIYLLDEDSILEDYDYSDSKPYVYVSHWFCLENDVYAMVVKKLYSNNSDHTEFFIRKARLENGQVFLENADLPELDLSCLVSEEEGYETTQNILNLFTVDGNLVLVLGEEWPEMLEVLNLEDGFCTEMELNDCKEVIPGPKGFLIITRANWSKGGNTADIQISSMALDNQNEELLVEISDCKDDIIMPCYDPGNNTLYFVRNGELCVMTQFDAERIESVNDCSQIGETAYYLSTGFVLIKANGSVLIKNTDPTQRGSVVLKIVDNDWGSVIPETIYEMNNVRGDISIVVQTKGDRENGVLEAMMTQDNDIDIYVMQYDSNGFSALRKRDYLPDLSENERIAENTSRLYPYIRDALSQNGKIIGVPITFSGTTLGIDKRIWKEVGGTEEELPKTWSQFFDWLEIVPERLEGQDVTLIMADYESFHGMILRILLDQYEIWMERMGKQDYAFASPMMCDLVHRLDSVNYDALYMFDEDDLDNEKLVDDSGSVKVPLLEFQTSTLMNGENQFEPMALSFEEGKEAVLPVEMNVAFLNPYSKHQQEATEFLALAMNNLDLYDKYTAYIDMIDPIRYPDFEENSKWIKDMIEELEKNQRTAKDEDKEQIEEEIQTLEESLIEYEQESWSISQKLIDNYQIRQSLLTIRGYSFINDFFMTDSSEEDYDDYELIFHSKKKDATMSPEELLGMLDQKVRMIRMERN